MLAVYYSFSAVVNVLLRAKADVNIASEVRCQFAYNLFTAIIRESLDSLCRDDADMPMPPYTTVKIIKNEIRYRDDTVPKTVDTRSHCKVWLRACNNLPKNEM